MEHPLPPGYYCRHFDTIVTRANLPHWHQDNVACFATFRLADSLPAEKLVALKEQREQWMDDHPGEWNEEDRSCYEELFSDRVQGWLDAGHGSCVLSCVDARNFVEQALRYFDGNRYVLYAFVVMPNHVHVLFKPLNGNVVSKIVHSWKCFTARHINKIMGQKGALWQKEYWDSLVRNEKQFAAYLNYIKGNDPDLAWSAYD